MYAMQHDMAPTAGTSHDLTISETGGVTNKRGFMLARENDLRRFGVEDSEAVPPRLLIGADFTEAESPPHLRAFWSQSNWQGFGAVVDRRSTEVKQFAVLQKAKTDIDGRLRPASEMSLTTFDVAPTETGTNGFAIVDTELWAFVGRDVYEWDDANTQWDKKTVPNAATVIYRNGVPAPLSFVVAASWVPTTEAAARYIYKRDSDAQWTQIGAGTGASPKYFATGRNANGNAIIWAGHVDGAPAAISSSTDPSSLANWSAVTTVGSANSEITALLDLENVLLICKQDGVWALSPDGVTTNLTPDFVASKHPNHFRGAVVWNGRALLPLGTGGLLELNGNELWDISPRVYFPEQAQFHGVITSIAPAGTRVFIMIRDTGTVDSIPKYHVLMGQLVDNDYVWHHMTSITTNTSSFPTFATNHTALMVVSQTYSTTNRSWLLIGIEDNGGDAPYSMSHEVQHGDWLYTNDADSIATTAVFDAGFPHLSKTFAAVDFETRNLGVGGRSVGVEYRTTRGGSWSSLGASVLNTSPAQTIAFPAATTGVTLEFRFTLNQTSATTTAPELIRFRVAYSLRNTQIEAIPLNLYLADNQELLNGTTESRVAGNLALLRTWDTQAAEVTIVDAEGTSRDMVFLPGTLKLHQSAVEAGRRPEWLVQVQLVEV